MSTVSFRSKRNKSVKRSVKKSAKRSVKRSAKSIKRSIKRSNRRMGAKHGGRTRTEDLIKMKKKYNVSTNGSKQEIAEGLWRVSGHTIDDKDLIKLMDLLPTNKKKEVKKLLDDRKNKPITNYRGLWEPKPLNLNTMNRQDLIHRIQKFRDIWEKITGRNQDLSNERLADDTVDTLRGHLKWYYSDASKYIAEDWLRK